MWPDPELSRSEQVEIVRRRQCWLLWVASVSVTVLGALGIGLAVDPLWLDVGLAGAWGLLNGCLYFVVERALGVSSC